jgi:DNA-binding response OmpR family regulator
MKILLVDDDRDLAELLSFGLLRAGFWPVPAYTGAQALDLLASEQPALVLLDIQLERENGLELLTQMRLVSNVPIIMMSAMTSDDTRLRAFELGADDYVVKPFGMRELLARIRARLRRRSDPEINASVLLWALAKRIAVVARPHLAAR